MSREQIMAWAWWVTNLCLQMGTEVHTAYLCGYEFAKGLDRENNGF